MVETHEQAGLSLENKVLVISEILSVERKEDGYLLGVKHIDPDRTSGGCEKFLSERDYEVLTAAYDCTDLTGQTVISVYQRHGPLVGFR